MNKYLFFLFLGFSTSSIGQSINTFAGNGTHNSSGDGGIATNAAIGYPDGCAFDKEGNFYFTQVNDDRVRKITTDGIITTVVGTATSGFNGDDIPATAAELNGPGAIAFDEFGNLYIADGLNSRVRKVNMVTGIITTFAGTGANGFSGDGGAATAAIFNEVADICFDIKGNLFVADGNNKIRKINTAGVINTIAGSTFGGPYTGDGGPAINAQLSGVFGICTDIAGNIYLAQSSNAVVCKIDTFGIISTIAGNGMAGPSGDGGPATASELAPVRLTTDNYGNLYVSCWTNHNVRKIDNNGVIHTIAGTGVDGFSGDGGPAVAAELSATYGIALDTCGNLYIADKDNARIRKVAFNPFCFPEKVRPISNTKYNIYPNPAYKYLTIESPVTNNTITLYDMLGRTLITKQTNTPKTVLNIEGLASGVYFVKVNSEKVWKVVKE